jgi:hypothetical protein
MTSTATPAPPFNASIPGLMGERFFRVYARSERLYFISYKGRSKLHLVLGQFGLLGALLWLAFRKGFERKLAKLLAELDQADPQALLGRDSASFVLDGKQLLEQSVAPAGLLKRGSAIAQWKFTAPEKGAMTLCLATAPDVDAAIALLPRLSDVSVELEWDVLKRKYVKRAA